MIIHHPLIGAVAVTIAALGWEGMIWGFGTACRRVFLPAELRDRTKLIAEIYATITAESGRYD